MYDPGLQFFQWDLGYGGWQRLGLNTGLCRVSGRAFFGSFRISSFPQPESRERIL
jgi:hypothetical protein